MSFTRTQTDGALLEELGRRLGRRRLDLGLRQADVAEEAGIAKRTLERLEGGGSVQLTSFLRVLRALGVVEGLEHLLPGRAEPGPMELLEAAGEWKAEERLRAPRRRARGGRAGSGESEGDGGGRAWKWGDER